ncbi:hypothetical protein N7481_003886 [Penicillium waksmanii]|uniref:uncharacterized protein n=1 Tax=Penicillium waksmanii TaxID=69791 RepID=UPI002547067E|nr:uncharacterized protein N7481_003886 [Penicillium waksmanii]KAJ5988676.1 hypothetical protein N7481_003886 [Penicillium waksmanii]
MACTVALSLREPVLEMENPSHPFFEPWRASLVLLRRMALDRMWRSKDFISDCEQGYLGVDKDHPDRAIYIYRECTGILNLNWVSS